MYVFFTFLLLAFCTCWSYDELHLKNFVTKKIHVWLEYPWKSSNSRSVEDLLLLQCENNSFQSNKNWPPRNVENLLTLGEKLEEVKC